METEKAEVILLDTDKKVGIGGIYESKGSEWEKEGVLSINVNPNVNRTNKRFKAKHMYITTDSGASEGSYVISKDFGVLVVSKIEDKLYFTKEGEESSFRIPYDISICSLFKFIVASTDKDLAVLNIDQDFINKYVAEYNAGNVIKYVNINFDFGVTEINGQCTPAIDYEQSVEGTLAIEDRFTPSKEVKQLGEEVCDILELYLKEHMSHWERPSDVKEWVDDLLK